MPSDYEAYLESVGAKPSKPTPSAVPKSSGDPEYDAYLTSLQGGENTVRFNVKEIDDDAVPPIRGIGDFLERGTEIIPGLGPMIRKGRQKYLKPMAEGIRSGARRPVGSAIEELFATELPAGPGMGNLGMLTNMGTRAVGAGAAAAAELPMELLSQLIESGPEEVALGGLGKLGNATGAFDKVYQGVKKIDEPLSLATGGKFTLTHRGGLTPAAKATMERFDTAEARAASEAEDIARNLTLNPDGSAITTKDQRLLGQLLEQPEQRAMLQQLNATDQPVHAVLNPEEFALAARPVPGVIPDSAIQDLKDAGLTTADIPAIRKAMEPHAGGGGTVGGMLDTIIDAPGFDTPRQGRKLLQGVLDDTTPKVVPARIIEGMRRLSADRLDDIVSGNFRPQRGDLIMPEVDTPTATLADIAEQVATTQRKNIEDVAVAMKTDVSSLTRMVDQNFNPRRYTSSKVGIWNTLSKSLRERKGPLKARRELTDQFRREEGLLTEPGAPNAMAHIQARRLVNTRAVFDDFAANPMVARPAMSQAEMDLNIGSKIVDELGTSWTKMPTDNSLGSLAGMMVRTQEANEINQLRRVRGGFERFIRETWGGWKFGKTVLAPKTHIRNFFSNGMMAHAAGLSPYNLKVYRQARKEILNRKGPFWDEAKQAGAEWTSGKGTHFREMMDDINPDKHTSIYETMAASLPKFLTKPLGKASKWMAEGYQDSEAFFKQALYIKYRTDGLGVTDAIRRADDAIINYAKMPQWVKVARSSPVGVPFLSFTYGATPRIAQTAMENPSMFLHYKMFGDAWNQMAMEAAGATPEEQQEIEALYPGGMMMTMPFRDAATNSLMVFDVARFTPTAGILPDRVEIPGVPSFLANLLGQNPIMSEGAKQMTGVDPYFKSPVIPMSDPQAEIGADLYGLDPESAQFLVGDVKDAESAARWASIARTALPDVLGGGGSQNLLRALTGDRTTFTGDPITPDRALLELLIGPMRNVEESKMRVGQAMERQERTAGSVASKKAKRAARRGD